MPRKPLVTLLALSVLLVMLLAALLYLPRLFDDISRVNWRGLNWPLMALALTLAFALELGNAFCAWLALSFFGFRRRFREILLLTTAATSANSVAPVPAGPPLRAWLQERILDIPWKASIRAIGCELLASYGVVFSIAMLATAYLGKVILPGSTGWFLVLSFAILFCACVAFIKRQALTNALTMIGESARGAAGALIFLSGINVAIVLASGGRIFLQVVAASPTSNTIGTFVGACAALCISRMASVVSLIPMGIGVREASLGAALVAFGIPLNVAVLVVITDRVLITLPYLSISMLAAPYLTQRLARVNKPG